MLPARFYELLTFAYDFFFLTWLPWGHAYIRGSLLLLSILVCCVLFLFNRNKLLVLALFTSSMLILWPAFFINYSPRYFYEALPLIVLTFVSLWSYACPTIKQYKRSLIALLIGYIFLLIVLCIQNLSIREKKLATMHHAIKALVSNIAGNTRPLCFVGFPIDGFGTGIEQAVWIMDHRWSYPIVYDSMSMIVQRQANLVDGSGWHLKCSHYFDKNYVSITISESSIRMTSLDPQKVIFYYDPTDILSLCKKVIHATDDQGNIIDVSIMLEQRLIKQKPRFVLWDYEKQTFFCV